MSRNARECTQLEGTTGLDRRADQSWRLVSPLRALFLRHMPLKRRQSLPRFLLVDHRCHPPDRGERESQNVEARERVKWVSER